MQTIKAAHISQQKSHLNGNFWTLRSIYNHYHYRELIVLTTFIMKILRPNGLQEETTQRSGSWIVLHFTFTTAVSLLFPKGWDIQSWAELSCSINVRRMKNPRKITWSNARDWRILKPSCHTSANSLHQVDQYPPGLILWSKVKGNTFIHHRTSISSQTALLSGNP